MTLSTTGNDGLLTALAHELRTPLTAIRGFAALLQSLDASSDDGARREITERLVRNAVQMEALLDSMLDAARDGQLELLHPEVISLHSSVRAVVDAIGPALEDHIVDVRGTSTYAFVDPNVLTRVLTRLLTNAARYSPRGSHIEIETRRVGGGFARMTVTDAGPGIPVPDIGLAIAQDLCVRSGGTLALLDAPGRGATFEVVLPSIAS